MFLTKELNLNYGLLQKFVNEWLFLSRLDLDRESTAFVAVVVVVVFSSFFTFQVPVNHRSSI